MFFSTVFEGNLNISKVNGVQIPFRMNYNHFPPFQTISDTFWEKIFFFFFLLDLVPPKKIGKKVNFFRIFSKFYHVILAYLECSSSIFTFHKPFWRELQRFFQKIEKIRFSKNFQKLDLILTGTRKFEFLCSYKLRKGI